MKIGKSISAVVTVLCVGASLGTLTSATLVVAAYVLIVFIFPILILPYLFWISWAAYMRSIGGLRPISAWRAIIVAVVAVPFCAFLPYGIARQELLFRAAEIPTDPSLSVSSVSADPFGNSSTGPGVIYRLKSPTDDIPAVSNLVDRLVTNGWKVVGNDVPGEVGASFGIDLRGPSSQSVRLVAVWNGTQRVYEDITIRQNLSPSSPAFFLLVQLTAALVLAAKTRFGRKNLADRNSV